jgi:hypothetical protein
MNKNTKKLFTFLIIALSFASCKKEEAIVANTTETLTTQALIYPSIKNGRLHFPSSDAFKSYMETIHKMPLEEVESLNVSHGFKSHYASGKGAADKIASLNEDSYSDDSYIPDHYFGAVLNEEHQIQVGNFICEANNDYSYMVPEGSEDHILDFETALAQGVVHPEDSQLNWQSYYGNLYVYPTNATLEISESLKDGQKDNKLNTRAIVSRQIRYSYFDSGRWRLHAESWKVNYGIYASIGIESKCNRVANFFSLWSYYVNCNISRISVAYQGNKTLEIETLGSTFTTPRIVTKIETVGSNDIRTDSHRAYTVFDYSIAPLGFSLLSGKPIAYSIAKLTVTGINLTSQHSGVKDNVTRNINMNVLIQ